MTESKKVPVFVVEDDPAWAASLTGKLGKFYSVSTFATGEDTVEKLLEIKPKFIVLDYHLEGQMTGYDTLKIIRKKLPESYVIMFSAQDDVQTAVDILDNGAYDYVVKKDPEVSFNRLKIIIRNIESHEALRDQVLTLNLRVRRERFWLGMLIFGIFIISFIIYLRICPHMRVIKWDPFAIEETQGCYDPSTRSPYHPKSPS